MELTYIKTNSANLDSIPKVDGQLISVSENSRRYLDFDGIRQGIATSDEIDAITDVYGSKNLLKIVRYVANGYNYNGVVITYNDDGSITCVGRSTDVVSLQISDNIYLDQNKQYIISGTTTGSSDTYFLQYSNNRDSAISVKTEEIVFTPYNYTTYPNQTAYIHIKSGVDINTTFYPMIRDARIKDSTYVPYSMTNAELTNKKLNSYSGSLGNEDLNSILSTGIYGFYTTTPNHPGSKDGTLLVINFDGYIVSQLVISADGLFVRRWYSGTWSNWVQCVNS